MAALQEAGLWRYAATLTAHTLKGDERAARARALGRPRASGAPCAHPQHLPAACTSVRRVVVLAGHSGSRRAPRGTMIAMGRLHSNVLLYQCLLARDDKTIFLAMWVQHRGKAWRALGASTAESRPRKAAVLWLPELMRAQQRSRAAACLQYEGNVWRALGIMAAAGGLRNAALLLRELRMPDAAAAFCAACKEAGFHSAYVPADAG